MSIDRENVQEFYANPTAYSERMGMKFDERWGAIFSEYVRKIKHHRPVAEAILDLGCGNGHTTMLLEKSIQCSKVTGVDISQHSLDLGKKHLDLSKIDLVCADVHHLPFEDESYDLVTSYAMIEHLAEAESALNEMHRVLKKGGTLVVSAPNMLSPVRALKLFLQSIRRGSFHPDGTPAAVIKTKIDCLKRMCSSQPRFEYRQPVFEKQEFAGSDFDAVFMVNPWDLKRWAKRKGYRIQQLADSSSKAGRVVELLLPYFAGGVHFVAEKPKG